MTPDDNNTTAEDEGTINKVANQMGPAGLTADNDVGLIVSGQPIGGPNDLGEKAHEQDE
ncbi:hypothetical protein [Sphingomonas sp.]|uniref:hypothetical protein n=1 Tax=Sphingomonas sp. TaxID=28214 RepID=UPI0025F43CC4|nr:hypothetical protein [Sphingomonas sp.]